ncbi:hypothetical protein GGQ85_004402 [Nitrobacter vulgaris]|uniref:hypothetical protein n=1 Tax=Nitrobacter vulgaris TaxID=29421 RepID=UPI00285B3E44|nr:hypothetical protein [Nitrobacter vulgaris]MDR6306668.1 hypothetical protein [Nitrobacter vulgaris]
MALHCAGQALVEVRRLEGLVRRTIGVLSQDAQSPTARIMEDEAATLVGRASVALADTETERSRQETEQDIRAIEHASKNFHKIEKEGRERIAIRARRRRWCSTPMIGRSHCSRGPAGAASTTI